MGTAEQDQWVGDALGVKMDNYAGLAPGGGNAPAAAPQSAANGQEPASGGEGGQDGAPTRDPNEPDLSTRKTGTASTGAASFSAGDPPSGAEPTSGGEGGGAGLGDIVSAGELAYTIFKDGAPTIESKSTFNFALPKGHDTSDMDSSQMRDRPHMTLPLQYDNLLGVTVIDLTITVAWEFGYSLGGKGLYIANAIVTATGSVLWGQSVVVSVQWGGWRKKDTANGPIAQLPIMIIATVKNLLKTENVPWSGFISGDGAGSLS